MRYGDFVSPPCRPIRPRRAPASTTRARRHRAGLAEIGRAEDRRCSTPACILDQIPTRTTSLATVACGFSRGALPAGRGGPQARSRIDSAIRSSSPLAQHLRGGLPDLVGRRDDLAFIS